MGESEPAGLQLPVSPWAGGGGREKHLQQEGRFRQTVELRLHAHTPEPGGAYGVLVGGDQQGWNGMVRASTLHTAGDAATDPSLWGRLDPQGIELTGDWANPTRILSIACSGCGRVDAEQTAVRTKTHDGAEGCPWQMDFSVALSLVKGLVWLCETFTSLPKDKYRN